MVVLFELAMAVNCRRLAVVCLAWAVVTVSAAGPCQGQEPFRLTPAARFLLGMGSGAVTLSGDLLVPAGGRPGSGTKVDLASDLGFYQAECTSITFQAAVLDRHMVVADYLALMPTGSARPKHTFLFHNKTYQPDTTLETRLEINWLRLCYGYKALRVSSWWLGPRVGAHYVRTAATINGETEEAGIISNTRSLDCTYPVLGLETRYLLPHGWELGLEMEGVHLFGRGFLSSVQVNWNWEVHPDLVVALSAFHRLSDSTETNQPLNNHWSYSLSGVRAGISVGF